MELKQSDLRVGNYILRDDKQIQVTPMTIFCLGKHHQPIKLTEEWLLKFGAEKTEHEDGRTNRYRIKDRLFLIRDGHFVDYGSSVSFLYVHQFQNFWHALKNEELTIK